MKKSKKQVLELIQNTNALTSAKFASLKDAKLNDVISAYETILRNKALTIGLNPTKVESYSIEKLEGLTNKFSNVKTELNETNKNRKPSNRQLAVIKAVEGMKFPIDVNEYKDAVIGAYSVAYFDLQGCEPTSLASAKTLFEMGEIIPLDGMDANTVLFELEKNGKFAASNAYSLKHKLGSHKSDVFNFTLTKDGNMVNYAKK